MSLKVLGGVLKGLSLVVPPKDTIRPMSVLLKRKIFDAFQDLSGVRFVDLCAGSGAVGIEAWSRGADEVWLNEISQKVIVYTQKNLEAVKKRQLDMIERPLTLRKGDAKKFFQNWTEGYGRLAQEQQENTVLFLAPPYPQLDVYENVLTELKKLNFFRGQLWVESDTQKGPAQEQIENWSSPAVKVYKQGTTFLLLINF